MILNQQTKVRITLLAGMIVSDHQEKIRLLLNNGNREDYIRNQENSETPIRNSTSNSKS